MDGTVKPHKNRKVITLVNKLLMPLLYLQNFCPALNIMSFVSSLIGVAWKWTSSTGAARTFKQGTEHKLHKVSDECRSLSLSFKICTFLIIYCFSLNYNTEGEPKLQRATCTETTKYKIHHRYSIFFIPFLSTEEHF